MITYRVIAATHEVMCCAAVQHERESRYFRYKRDVSQNGDSKLVDSTAFDACRFITLLYYFLAINGVFTEYSLSRSYYWAINNGDCEAQIQNGIATCAKWIELEKWKEMSLDVFFKKTMNDMFRGRNLTGKLFRTNWTEFKLTDWFRFVLVRFVFQFSVMHFGLWYVAVPCIVLYFLYLLCSL